jgi:AcrR family transcriptional regulator
MAAGKKRDAERTKQEILEAAFDEFALTGFAGARADNIAKRVGITKPLIFYYFPNKDDLYMNTLEYAYQGIREREKDIDVSAMGPRAAMMEIAAFTFDYYTEHPNFVRLIASENIHGSVFLKRSKTIRRQNRGIIELIDSVLKRGEADKTIRKGLAAIDVHMWISAMAFFCVANAHTFGTIFEINMHSPDFVSEKRRQLCELVDRYVAK